MVHNANEQLRESLSALMDNQASDIELRRLLKNMEGNESLAGDWRRYHLIGEIVRGAKPAAINVDISAAVAAAISQDAAPAAKVPWQAWLGKSTLAASVALAVLVGVRQIDGNPEMAPLANAPATQVDLRAAPDAIPAGNAVAGITTEYNSVQNAPAGFIVPLPDARAVSSNGNLIRRHDNGTVQPVVLPNPNWRNDPALQQELNQLLIDHASRASANGSLGILPFSRVSSMKPTQE